MTSQQVVKFLRILNTKTGNEFFNPKLVQVQVFVFLVFSSNILWRNTCFCPFCLNLGDMTTAGGQISRILKTKTGNEFSTHKLVQVQSFKFLAAKLWQKLCILYFEVCMESIGNWSGFRYVVQKWRHHKSQKDSYLLIQSNFWLNFLFVIF